MGYKHIGSTGGMGSIGTQLASSIIMLVSRTVSRGGIEMRNLCSEDLKEDGAVFLGIGTECSLLMSCLRGAALLLVYMNGAATGSNGADHRLQSIS